MASNTELRRTSFFCNQKIVKRVASELKLLGTAKIKERLKLASGNVIQVSHVQHSNVTSNKVWHMHTIMSIGAIYKS